MKDLVQTFGAIGNGVFNNTAAFNAAIASGGCYIPNGIYNVTELLIPNRVEFEGESRDGVIIQCDGDMFTLNTVNSSLVLDNCAVKNITTRGQLVKKTVAAHTNESVFNNVYFKKANYHINTYALNAGWGIVDWRFTNCRFEDAAVASRQHGSIWACTERDCYTWQNVNGLMIYGNIATVKLADSVFELNTMRCFMSNTAAGLAVEGLTFDSIHFEANGSPLYTPISFYSQAAPVSYAGVGIHNVTTFAPNHPLTIGLHNITNNGIDVRNSPKVTIGNI